MTAQIVVVGSLNMDLVARSPRIPAPGETIFGHDFNTVPGGKGANQAIAAARLGAQVTMVGRLGTDAFAGPLRQNLMASGVDHTFVQQDPEAATGIAVILVDDAGENSIVVASGANMRLSPADVEFAEAAIARADILLLQLEVPPETVLRAAELAKRHGVTVILNPAPARSLPPDILPLVDIFIPNEHEAAFLAGMPVHDLEQAKVAAGKLRALGVSTVILTLGGRGSLLLTSEIIQHVPAFEITPVDTTGAGDAFVAGFSVAWAEAKSPVEAVRWGNAAGALAATKLGAQPSLPTRASLERLLDQGAALKKQ